MGYSNKVSLAIVSALPSGWNIQQYCEEVLKLKYPTFKYRQRKGRLHLEDYQKILATTGKTWEELFGIRPNPLMVENYRNSSSARITEVRGGAQLTSELPPVPPPDRERGEFTPTRPPIGPGIVPQIEPKKEEAVTPPAFVVEDIELTLPEA